MMSHLSANDAVRRYFDGPYFALNFGSLIWLRRTLGRFFRRDTTRIDRTCVSLLREFDVSSVLDLGCGSGGLLESLDRDRRFSRAAGVDLSQRSLEVARTRFRSDGRLSFEHAAAHDCRALGERFDAVVSIGMFDYGALDTTLLTRMLNAAIRVVVITLPRRHIRTQRALRRAWLLAHGVRLRAYSERAVLRACQRAGDGCWTFRAVLAPGLDDNIWIIGRRARAPSDEARQDSRRTP